MNEISGHEWPIDGYAMKNVWSGNTYLMMDDDIQSKDVFGRIAEFFEQIIQILADDFCCIQRAITRQGVEDTSLTRGEEEKVSHLQQAIMHGQSALRTLTRAVHPLEWARAHASLGEAYRQATYCADLRERYSGRAVMQEQALRHMEAALQVFTQQEHPQEWMRVQRALGMLYAERVRGERRDNIGQARDCYENALQVCASKCSSRDKAALHLLLGGILLLTQDESLASSEG